MPGSGRPKAELVLSDVEHDTLLRWSRRAKTSQALALRAKIVLACAEGLNNKEVAAKLGIWPQTVGKWRARFVTHRKVCPASASRRKIRHHGSYRLSQHAPTGMNTCLIRGWSINHSRVDLLSWLDRLSVIT
jgi:hypothetical protein